MNVLRVVGIVVVCRAMGVLGESVVPCVPADPSAASLFRPVSTVDDFEREPLAWRASHGAQNAAATLSRDTAQHKGGVAALRAAYDFVGNRDYEYVQLEGRATFAKPGAGFGFWIKGDGTAFNYRLRVIDASGETHQFDIPCERRSSDWQFVGVSLDAHSEAWGGDKNWKLDYPCRLGGILIDRPSPEFSGKGSVWLDDVAVLAKRPAAPSSLKVSGENVPFGNVYAVGDRVALHASGTGDRIVWALEDFWGAGQAAGQGPASGTPVAFALDRAGYYVFRIALMEGDAVKETVTFPCAALPGGRVAAASDFLGMCTHYGHGSYPLETMDLLRRYGIDQFRDEISWRAVECEKGVYGLPGLSTNFLGRARALKMRPLLIYDYANPLYDNGGFPNSDEAITAYARYATYLTGATRGLVDQFEVWNEWCGGCGMRNCSGAHDGAAYGRMLGPTYAAVKRAFPQVTLVGMGGEYGPKCASNIVAAVGTAGPRAMDAWSIHPYRYPRPPEVSDLIGEVGRIADQVAAAGATSPVWVTEIGYPTQLDARGCTLAEQARYAVRTAICLQGAGRVKRLFWYDFKDDGLDRTYNENNFGLVRHQKYNCAPKPAIVALAAWVRLTAGAVFQSLRQQDGVWTAAYRLPSGEDLLVAWVADGTRDARVAGRLAEADDLMGVALDCGGALRLSVDPVYLRGKNLSISIR